MPVNLNQYKGTVGVFNNCNIAFCNFCNIWYSQLFQNCSTFIFFNAIFICVAYLFALLECLRSSFLSSLGVKFCTIHTCLNLILYISILLLHANHFWLYKIVLKLTSDIKENLGPKPSSNQSFSICRWNLNSISALNYIKVSLLRAYVSPHKFDVICISETYLDSDTTNDNDNLKIAGYNLIQADHPSNTKQGGVCIYYKHSLAFKLLSIHYLKLCMNFEISFGGTICNFISLYCSSSQSSETFEDFADNFELNLDKIFICYQFTSPYLSVVLDFNVKSSNWYKHNKTTYEGSKIDAITSQFGLQQLIKEPTHVLTDSSSCIDLLFTSQHNLVMESGVHSSLHQNCHHQIIHAKINLKVCYPPPYERETWHYQHVNVDEIPQVLEQFSWEKSFRDLNINEMVSLFKGTFKNILSNYIPHETILCDDNDPPWFNNNIKQLIQRKTVHIKQQPHKIKVTF